ncbi:nucleoside/nucleotide kinase family protein [Pedobacter gandavensis]|uniref:Sulfotransferase family protein n=1 Tax=Pedobacter gandavensis TaxID=2679963 RepID=A0ABR6EXH9_9SPHI|nr:hypothetical protein [Pedobacter gandavensis]MBB2149934.1 hypothetical protein [Pedobacter gandavensis]
MMNKSPLTNWIPHRLSISSDEEWMLHWMDLEDRHIMEPFFDETINICSCRRKDKRRLPSLSTTDFLSEVAAGIPHLPPTAFVFHVSRCGSTLLSQAFTLDSENIIIAEAPLLDEILRASEKKEITEEKRKQWFMAAVQLMGQLRNGNESAYIVKLDSWHLHFYDILRSWYPNTPFFFLSRKPDEVLASHEKRAGIHTVPGLVNKQLLKIDPQVDYGGNFSRFTADVLKGFYQQMSSIQQLQHPKNAFADYGEGISTMIDRFSRFSGVHIRGQEQLQNRLNYHSKSNILPYQKEQEPELRHQYPDCMEAYENIKRSS